MVAAVKQTTAEEELSSEDEEDFPMTKGTLSSI